MKFGISPHHAFAEYFDKWGKLYPFLFTLSQKMGEGNICIDVSHEIEIKEEVITEEENEEGEEISLEPIHSENKQINWNDFEFTKTHQHLIGQKGDTKPFILYNNKLYTHKFFHYESSFIRQIKKFVAEDNSSRTKKLDNISSKKDFILNLFPHYITSEIDWQLIACISAYINNFSIITGGPGTGKTTTVSKLLTLILDENPNLKILLAAPTGKAAARMKESLSQTDENFKQQGIDVDSKIIETIKEIDASTIHRMLGYQYKSIHFKHNEDKPLDADVVVVDECSMIDITLFKKLLEAIDPKRTKLILLGDKNQLASVEAGSLFGDLCNSLDLLNQFDESFIAGIKKLGINWELSKTDSQHPLSGRVVELQKSHRFVDDKGIGKLSKAILQADKEVIHDFFKNKEDQINIVKKETAIIDQFADLLFNSETGYIQEQDISKALKKINQSKIICTTRHGEYGVKAINKKIEGKIIGSKERKGEFYHNQLIMVTQNQAKDNIFNGDIGIVRETIDVSGGSEKKILYAYFPNNDNEPIKILPGNIAAWDLAYAITIHKSQGSEFDEILITLPDSKSKMLTRELIYTAITRAKNNVTIICDEETLQDAAQKSVERISGVKERILEEE